MAQKFKYETVIYELEVGWRHFMSGTKDQKYVSVINAKAEQGWRLVSAFVPPTGSSGFGRILHFIFEKEV